MNFEKTAVRERTPGDEMPPKKDAINILTLRMGLSDLSVINDALEKQGLRLDLSDSTVEGNYDQREKGVVWARRFDSRIEVIR